MNGYNFRKNGYMYLWLTADGYSDLNRYVYPLRGAKVHFTRRF